MKNKIFFIGMFLVLIAFFGCGPTDNTDIGGLLNKSPLYAIGFMFLAGILTSFTPCVYPMIPITVSIFGARGATTKLKAFVLSIAYTMGIALTYSSLGVGAALTGTAFGSYMSSTPVVVIIIMIFLMLAMSMAGLYELTPPPRIMNRLSKVGGASLHGAFLMGLVAGFVAAPCTGPVLAGALTYVATTRSVVVGALLLFSYALGMGLLFIVIGTFAGIVGALPKSGRWMELVRSSFAVVMVAAAFYFLNNVFPSTGAIFAAPRNGKVVSAAFLLVGILTGGLHLEATGRGTIRKLRKGVASLLTGVGVFGLVLAFAPGTPPSPSWIGDFKTALKAARTDSKPAVIDFYADWCTACKELDRKTWSDKKVIDESKNFIMIRVDATSQNDTVDELEDEFNVLGLPAVLFIGPDGKEVARLRVTGFVKPDEMLNRMQQVK